MNKTRYYLTFMSLFLISGMAFAAEGNTDKLSFLNPPITDKSISYLGQLFGTVGTVLHGSSGQLLAKIFEIFNLGILVIASVLATYTIFKSVLSTAQDGEFMGKQGKSSWIAVRTFLGVGFLAPVFSGYSAIQVLMMWVVVHGVGFADAAWEKALSYLKNGGQLYTPPQEDNAAAMLDKSLYILKAQVCMYESKRMAEEKNRQLQELKQTNPTEASSQKMETGTYISDFDKDKKANPFKYNFPGGVGDHYAEDKCGHLTFKPGTTYNFKVELTNKNFSFVPSYTLFTTQDCSDAKKDAEKKAQSEGLNLNSSDQSIIDDVYNQCTSVLEKNEGGAREGMVQMVLDLSPIAQELANTQKIEDPSKLKDSTQSKFVNDFKFHTSNSVIAALIGASADFINIAMPQLNTQTTQTSKDVINDYYDQAIMGGWITAGAFYYDLGKIQRSLDKNFKDYLQKPNPENVPTSQEDYEKLGFNKDIAQHSELLIKNIKTYGELAKNAISQMSWQSGQDKFKFTWKTNDVLTAIWNGFLNDVLNQWQMVLFSGENPNNPILSLQRLGYRNMDISLALYFGTVTVVGLISAGTAFTPFFGSAIVSALTNLIVMVVPLLTTICTALFATGSMFAVYIPFIPYLLFTFGAIGWLITVLEAMVAGPLVALGVTHPEGHDLLGKSEQALMMMLSVFLKPVLMVIGMLGGMVLSFVALKMINLGFSVLTSGILAGTGGFTALAVILVIEAIYASIIIAIINQSYSLIYHIPDKVLRWIGAPEMGTGKPEGVGKVEQAAGEAGKEIGHGGEKGSTVAPQIFKKAEKFGDKRRASKNGADATIQTK